MDDDTKRDNKDTKQDKAVQGIAKLIIAEARNAGGDDIGRATYHVHLLVRARVLEMVNQIRA